MNQTIDIFQSKKENIRDLEMFLKSEEAKKLNAVAYAMFVSALSDLKEVVRLSEGFYLSSLKNIKQKRLMEIELETLKEISRDFHYNAVSMEVLG